VGIKHITKKKKLARIRKIRRAPRWADIRKYGLKRARTRRISVSVKKWRRSRLRV
jgi:hypothetical protein